jgi:O-antigen/teichoic acid export membrane protein
VSVVLGGLALIQGFENIAVVDFERSVQYDRVFRYQLAAKIVGVLVTIPAAFFLRNYWALICGIAAGRITRFLMGYAMKPYRPRFSLAGWRDLFNFSKWLMITNVLTVIDMYCMTLAVGRIAGTPAIGVYQVANQIGSLPASEIAAPIRDPIFAGYSRIAEDLTLLRKHFLSNFSLLVAVIAPLSLGICLMAEPITVLFLGQKWMAAVQLIRLTALYALFDSIGHSAGAIYMTLHRQRRFVELFTLIIAIRIPAIVVGAYLDGVNGAAIALVITAAVNMILWNGYIPAELAVKGRDFWHASWRTVLACVPMAVSVWVLLESWPAPAATLPALVRFIAICLAGGVVHITTQLAAWLLSGSPATAEAEVLHLVQATQKRVARIMLGRAASSA